VFDRFGRLFLSGALALLLPSIGFAQARMTGADLQGTVRDATGAMLAGTSITVTNLETHAARTSASDDTGHYVVAALPPGTYSVVAELPSFRAQQHDAVVLTLGQTFEVDFVLAASAGETITVTERAPSITSNHLEIGSVITQLQIQSLPTNGRNFIGFAALVPGVAPDHTPLQGAAATSGLSFAGQRGRSNNVTVDGLDNNDPVMGAVRATFSQEAVREFQVLVDSYSAEFGKASGGAVNIVTKSGTSAVHGSAFLFFRDKALNARNYFDKFDAFGNPVALEKPPYRQAQWGGTVGGPVRKNGTYYFVSYEGTRITDSRLVTIDPVAAILLDAQGFPTQLGNVPFTVKNSETFGKIDRQWTPTRSLAVRGAYADINREALDDFGGIVAKSRATVQLRKDWSVSASETDVLSTRWINELRGQYAHENQHVNSLDPVCGGPCDDVSEGGPTVEVTGVASVGRQRITPLIRLNRRVQLVDTVSYYRKSHHLKFGVDYGFVFFPTEGNVLGSQFGGRFIFSAIPALGVTSSLDGLRKGMPAAYIQGFGNPHYPDERYGDLSLFAQDEWRRGRWTVRPGARYQVQFWQDTSYTVSDVGGKTLTYRMPQDRNKIAPRLSLSYDLSGTGRTVVRGAYGVFYDNMIMIVENSGRVTTGTASGARSFVATAPLASSAWNAPGHRLSETQALALVGGTYASAVLAPNPSLKTSFARQASAGVDRDLTGDVSIGINVLYVRGFNLPGTLDYNPLLPATLGAGRRPNDVPCARDLPPPCVNGGIVGSSSSVIQPTSYGESWYTGVTLEVRKRLSRGHQFMASYTLSKAEDLSTDFQTTFIAQNNGSGRNPADPSGLPLGFDPQLERGLTTQDQRHRFIVSGVYQLPWSVQLSGIVSLTSGRPFTPLAGADLNGDGNGGQFPPDRARRNPADESTSVARNSETTAGQASVDVRVSRRIVFGPKIAVEAMLEAFNLFNRANFFEDTNQSSFVIFGSGAYPSNPLPAYGLYTQTLPPRQIQVAARMIF
jgi:hypothetical protein